MQFKSILSGKEGDVHEPPSSVLPGQPERSQAFSLGSVLGVQMS